MATNAQGLAARLANAIRVLARVRLCLISMGQAGVLLRADVQLYEITRRKLVDVGKQLISRRCIPTQLYFPAPVPTAIVALAQTGTPSATVMIRAAAQAGRLQGAQQATPMQDPADQALREIEREVQTMKRYIDEREYDTGLAVPPQQQTLDHVYAALSSPQVLGVLSLGASLLVSTIAMAGATSKGDPVAVLQQGVALAKDLLRPMQAAGMADAPTVVEAKVIESAPAAKCGRPETHKQSAQEPVEVVAEVVGA